MTPTFYFLALALFFQDYSSTGKSGMTGPNPPLQTQHFSVFALHNNN